MKRLDLKKSVPTLQKLVLPSDSEERILKVLCQRTETVVNTLFDAEISVKDLSSLEPRQWLNDEVYINCLLICVLIFPRLLIVT